MKLREWAADQGISYRTALRWFHSGTLAVEAEQMAAGTIIVKLDSISANLNTSKLLLWRKAAKFLLLTILK